MAVYQYCVDASGKVDMQELMFETDAGYTMSAYIFIPEGVNADNPAPAIVTSHGYLNNKEMQDANYVELARRGFVVLAIDQPCHGDSEILQINTAPGVYQGALALSRMPFVDAERIGVTGHSMGGRSCNAAIASDNAADEQVIAAVLLNCADATYVDEDGNWANVTLELWQPSTMSSSICIPTLRGSSVKHHISLRA